MKPKQYLRLGLTALALLASTTSLARAQSGAAPMVGSLYAGQLTTVASTIQSLSGLNNSSGASTQPSTWVNGLVCKALSTNTGTIWVGSTAVSATNGYPLIPGEAMPSGPILPTNVYTFDTTSGDKIACTGS